MKDTMNDSRRRFLLKSSLVLGGAIAGASAFAQAKKPDAKKPVEKAGADLPLVDEKAPLAVTLKYSSDAAKVPAALKVAKAGVAGKDQNCGNCMFYTKAGKHGADEAGKCQLFTQGNVLSKGWCSSWAKKA